MICYLYEAPKFLFFATDVPDLLYYSHIPSLVIALIVGFFVFFNARHLLLNRLLLLISISFSAWVVLSLLVWAGNDASLFAFIWPFYGVLAAFLAVFSIYFTYVFLTKEDVSNRLKLLFLFLLLPVLIFAPTDLSTSGFNLVNCGSFEYEGFIYKLYYTLLGFLAVTWILFLLIKHYRKATPDFKKQILLMGIGVEFFLASFISMTYIASYLVSLDLNPDSSFEFYSLFGMTFFMTMMGVLIVRFKTFNVGLHATNALVIALLILVGSQFTYVDTTVTTILTGITLVLTAVAGVIIIRSVKKEIEQREQLEVLTKKLEKANAKLKVLDKLKSEFVSIASHQLRSPLTSIRGYASMLLEGSYGHLSQKAKDAVDRIAESSRMMALSVEDYLNVSRIQAGNMKYEYSDFNLVDVASGIADDIRQEAVRKGLVLSFKSDMNGQGIVHADKGKTMQIIHNLVNNALKYTPKGTIVVFAHDEKKKINIDIVDTGIGMSPETIETIFGKFERAQNANEVNISGTGLGLYVAQKMAQEMGGDIKAFSDGEGEGSTFRLTLPMQM